MSLRRSRLQETGETSRTENVSQGCENPPLTAAQIAQLVAATVEQILANRPEANPLPDQQTEEIRGPREEVARLREARVVETPPPTAREVPLSTEVLAAELPQHFKFPNVGEYDGMGDPEEHLSRFENAALLHQYTDPIKCRVFVRPGDRPAEAPLCPAWLPEEPVMAKADQTVQNRENKRGQTSGYQESSVDKAQRLSWADLINHHHLVIFRCDDSADHHKAVVFRHDDSAVHHIKSSVGPFRRDDSVGR
ncbi:hypothetical protein F511_34916 [Dorcoceras hygrometricum]|uniref:Uncharacterized protein n=1 Tax=Dorcoceras hygrometricum TaxID=472368 RepID=A0A2Z7CTQ2_9LAMI|nr:hypothetical protein F511_34916 [Dorcoceras hygrometricum]